MAKRDRVFKLFLLYHAHEVIAAELVDDLEMYAQRLYKRPSLRKDAICRKVEKCGCNIRMSHQLLNRWQGHRWTVYSIYGRIK